MRENSNPTHSIVPGLRRSLVLLLGLFLLLSPATTLAQYTKFYDFGSRKTGSNPLGTPVSDGTFLYGTASSGSPTGFGIIYKVKLDGSAFTQLYVFDGDSGSNPIGDLLYDGTFLFGMTRTGGDNSQGTIFKIKPDGTAFESIFSFMYIPTGGFPYGSLITDGNLLYGMTSQGGTGFVGTVFKINKDGTGHTKLLEFNGTGNGNGPQGSLLFDGTFLYGMTNSGGSSDEGTIFKIKPDGTSYTKLLDFDGTGSGANPLGSLVSDGTFLYGMTLRGGSNNGGTLFKIQPDGGGFVKMVDFIFGTNGGVPKGSLAYDGTFLYGMNTQAGANFTGIIFKIKPDGSGFTKLLDMTGDTSGPFPEGTFLLSGAEMYGVRSAGGGGRYGTIFKVNNDGSAFTTLFTFEIEANNPVGRPVSDGTSFYGLASSGGLNDDGAIYKINPNGTGYTRVFEFDRDVSGARPNGSLAFDGTFFYGMTSEGGVNNEGTIFKVKPNGTSYQKLLDFDDPVSGSYPYGSFISDGTFLYGMTSQGGTLGDGIIFKIQLNGTGFTKLLDLDYTNNGVNPYGTLIFDGTFLYGLTSGGGVNGSGVAFKIKTDGSGFVKLHDFDYPEGSNPRASLTAIGTTLYGFTSSGGLHGYGNLFKVNNNGTGFTVLLDFDRDKNGAAPTGSLISVGGFLFGMTNEGGLLQQGTLFRIKPDGTGYQRYLDFNDGNQPVGSLASDGTFLYGTTSRGGENGLGTFFRISNTPFAKLSSFDPTHSIPGQYITLRGSGFDPTATNNIVAFNGAVAEVISGITDSLVVVVPDDATDGLITVTAGGTSDSSIDDFILDSEAEMIDGKVKTCSATFVEPNTTDNLVETFIPGVAGGKLKVTFASFNVQDILNIYDGPDTSSPLLVASVDINVDDEYVATSAGGELTFEYIWQDASSQWAADISCDGIDNSISIDTQPALASGCAGTTVTLTTVASGTTNLTYHWQFSLDGSPPFNDVNNGGGYSNATTATLSVNTTGNFGKGFYRCRVNGDFALEEITDAAELIIMTTPAAPVASATPAVCGPASVTISVAAAGGLFSWYTAASGGTALAGQTSNLFATPVITTTTTYYATNTAGACESARTPVVATVEACDLIVYNAVSPNGDNKNDVFVIEFIDVIPGKLQNKVHIYNRWGDEVFSVSNYDNKDRVFAGNNNKGNKLPGGIYYYSIAFSDGTETLTGYLELRY